LEQWLQRQVFDGARACCFKERNYSGRKRFNVPGLGNESKHLAIAEQKLIAYTVLGEGDVTSGDTAIQLVKRHLTEPGSAQRMPLGRGANTAHVQSTTVLDEPIDGPE
jgi:hypothetical protein